MLLSKPAIERFMALGEIIISPFDPRNLKSAQYDVTLGKHYWRPRRTVGHPDKVYNPFDETSVRGAWMREHAQPHSTVARIEHWAGLLKGIAPEEQIVLLGPGETILAHTEEFIGSNSHRVTAMMKARSSMGRNFLEVCRCAGMGDHGYFNRWTLEIQNNSRDFTVPLVAGRRVGQLLFFQTEPLGQTENDYIADGKYQSTGDLLVLQKSWTPDEMLPKQWLDREVR